MSLQNADRGAIGAAGALMGQPGSAGVGNTGQSVNFDAAAQAALAAQASRATRSNVKYNGSLFGPGAPPPPSLKNIGSHLQPINTERAPTISHQLYVERIGKGETTLLSHDPVFVAGVETKFLVDREIAMPAPEKVYRMTHPGTHARGANIAWANCVLHALQFARAEGAKVDLTSPAWYPEVTGTVGELATTIFPFCLAQSTINPSGMSTENAERGVDPRAPRPSPSAKFVSMNALSGGREMATRIWTGAAYGGSWLCFLLRPVEASEQDAFVLATSPSGAGPWMPTARNFLSEEVRKIVGAKADHLDGIPEDFWTQPDDGSLVHRRAHIVRSAKRLRATANPTDAVEDFALKYRRGKIASESVPATIVSRITRSVPESGPVARLIVYQWMPVVINGPPIAPLNLVELKYEAKIGGTKFASRATGHHLAIFGRVPHGVTSDRDYDLSAPEGVRVQMDMARSYAQMCTRGKMEIDLYIHARAPDAVY